MEMQFSRASTLRFSPLQPPPLCPSPGFALLKLFEPKGQLLVNAPVVAVASPQLKRESARSHN